MKKIKKITIGLGAAYFAYLSVGMLLPFMKQKKISNSEQAKRNENRSKYYGNQTFADKAKIIESSTEALGKRIQMIELAKKQIVVTTFDMRKGESSSDIAAALLAAAERGVKIKVLVDGMSGMVHMKGRALFHTLSLHPNIDLRIYNKINFLKPWGIHGRMHDKYVIMDNECYLLGGRNSFDYFLGDYIEKNRSFDREVFVFNTKYKEEVNKESSLYQVDDYFNRIWNSKYVKPFTKQKYKKNRLKKEERRLANRYVQLKKEKPEWFVKKDSLREGTLETKKITLVSGEQHILGKRPIVWEELKNLMLSAKESVEMHTPYVVLNAQMYQDMRRIVTHMPNFKVVLNSITNGDNFVASSDYIRNKKHILDTGVTLYEFDGGDSAHGKSILIDKHISVVGSYNLDLRSTYMDTELMLVIDSEEINKSLDSHLEEFRKRSRKVINETEYKDGNTTLEIKEVSEGKRMAWKIVGFLLHPFRFLI